MTTGRINQVADVHFGRATGPLTTVAAGRSAGQSTHTIGPAIATSAIVRSAIVPHLHRLSGRRMSVSRRPVTGAPADSHEIDIPPQHYADQRAAVYRTERRVRPPVPAVSNRAMLEGKQHKRAQLPSLLRSMQPESPYPQPTQCLSRKKKKVMKFFFYTNVINTNTHTAHSTHRFLCMYVCMYVCM